MNDFDSTSFALGSPLKPCTLAALEESHKDDIGYKDFRKKLSSFFNKTLPAINVSLPNQQYLRLNAGDNVSSFFILHALSMTYNVDD